MVRKKVKFEADRCDCCNQTTNYILAIDRGSTTIMKKIARAVARKELNCVHLSKEQVLNHSELCNMIRPHAHGLVERVEGENMQGNYAITPKGFDFLQGYPIPKYAVVSKSESRTLGYFEPEENKVRISDFNKSDDYWEGVTFDIIEGNVIKKV